MVKIWRYPEVRVLAQTSFTDPGQPFEGWTTNDDGFNTSLDVVPEVAGRVCYMSFGKGRKTNAEYLQHILAQGHESVLEHASVTFGIQGVSRTLTHELVRHRHLSFSQTSQRYVTEPIEFVEPPGLRADDLEAFKNFCSDAKRNYEDLLGKYDLCKATKETARSVLPNCTATNVVVTGNLRAWRYFVKVRGTAHADAEIRRLACVILRQLQFIAPHCVQDLEVTNGEVRTIGAVSDGGNL